MHSCINQADRTISSKMVRSLRIIQLRNLGQATSETDSHELETVVTQNDLIIFSGEDKGS